MRKNIDLLFISELSQLEAVLDDKLSLFKNMQIVTADMAVAYELEKLQIEFIDEWSLINSSDIKNNFDYAWEIAGKWWDENISSTIFKDIVLSVLTKDDILYSIEASLNAITIYSRLFDRYQINSISGYFMPSTGVVRTGPLPAKRSVRTISDAVMFFYAERYKIQVNKLMATSSAAESTGVYWFPYTQRKPIKHNVDRKEDQIKKSIIIYENGFSPNEYETIVKLLYSIKGIDVISISQQTLERGFQFIEKNDTLISVFESFWKSFIKYQDTYTEKYPEIFRNIFLTFQFEAIKNEMLKAASLGQIFQYFVEILKPSMVVFGHESYTVERFLVNISNKLNIPTVCFVHGGLGHIAGMRGSIGDSEIVTVWSELDKKILESYGIDKSRIKVIGCIKYHIKYEQYQYKCLSQKDMVVKSIFLNNSIILDKNKPIILILTAAINTGFAGPVAIPQIQRDAFRELIQFVRDRQDIQFILKPHPNYDDYGLYKKLIDYKYKNLIYLDNVSLDQIIEYANICVLLSNFSTSALESMLCRIPVLYYDGALYPYPEWQPKTNKSLVCFASSISELTEYIDLILSDSVFRNKVLGMADMQIKEIMGIKEVDPLSRLKTLISDIINPLKTIDAADTCINTSKFNNNTEKTILFTSKRLLLLSENIPCGIVAFIYIYICGINNYSFVNSRSICMALSRKDNNKLISDWNESKWLYLDAYLAGLYNHLGLCKRYIYKIYLFIPYIINIKKFNSLSLSSRRILLFSLMRTIFGFKIASFLASKAGEYYNKTLMSSKYKKFVDKIIS